MDEKKYSKADLVKILESLINRGKRIHMKVAETEFAAKKLETTMQNIKEHNIEATGQDQGHADATKEFNERINQLIIEIINQ
jgi:ketol-acid reductoisomerase